MEAPLVNSSRDKHNTQHGLEKKFLLVLWRDETKLPRHTIKTRRLTHTKKIYIKRSISILSFFIFFPNKYYNSFKWYDPQTREKLTFGHPAAHQPLTDFQLFLAYCEKKKPKH